MLSGFEESLHQYMRIRMYYTSDQPLLGARAAGAPIHAYTSGQPLLGARAGQTKATARDAGSLDAEGRRDRQGM